MHATQELISPIPHLSHTHTHTHGTFLSSSFFLSASTFHVSYPLLYSRYCIPLDKITIISFSLLKETARRQARNERQSHVRYLLLLVNAFLKKGKKDLLYRQMMGENSLEEVVSF